MARSRRGLQIRHHVAVLVVVSSLGGFTLAAILALGYRRIDRESASLGANSVSLRDVDALQKRVDALFVVTDLVFSRSTYLADGAIEVADQISPTIRVWQNRRVLMDGYG